jgi:hypothetical protein
MANVLKIVSHKLATNGYFIITCFDGAKIAKLLNGVDKWEVTESDVIKYSIKRKYKGDTLNLGQQIDVLLPFTRDYYEEYLVNFDVLRSIAPEHGLFVKNIIPFSEYINKSTDMDKNDIDFARLYSVIVIQKVE